MRAVGHGVGRKEGASSRPVSQLVMEDERTWLRSGLGFASPPVLRSSRRSLQLSQLRHPQYQGRLYSVPKHHLQHSVPLGRVSVRLDAVWL